MVNQWLQPRLLLAKGAGMLWRLDGAVALHHSAVDAHEVPTGAASSS
jgi:hypothetical protein